MQEICLSLSLSLSLSRFFYKVRFKKGSLAMYVNLLVTNMSPFGACKKVKKDPNKRLLGELNDDNNSNNSK